MNTIHGVRASALRSLAATHTTIVARPVLIHAFWNSGYADQLQAVRFCNS